MKCPGCGRESVADSVFCTYCGVKMIPDAKVENRLLEADTTSLREAVSRRRGTDRQIPPWLVVVPFILNLLFGFVMVAAIFSAIFEYDIAADGMPPMEELYGDIGWIVTASMVVGILFYGTYAVIAYALVDRSNRHLEREAAVMEAVNRILEKVSGGRSERPASWDEYGAPLDPRPYGTKRVPLVWAMAILVPVLGSLLQYYTFTFRGFDTYESTQFAFLPFTLVHALLMFYMLHFLTDDAWKHDQAWTYFARGTKVAIAKAGGTAGGMDEGYPMQRRPSALYIILSFVTFGLFLVFWWYAAVKDTNDHYARQAWFEDELLAYFSGNR